MKPGIRKTMAPKPAARGGGGARGKAAASGAKGRGAGAGASGSGGGDAGRMVQVRVIEDGFDLTPLPLLLSTRAETPSLAVAQAEELASSVDSPSEGSEASEGDLEASLEDSEDEFEDENAKPENVPVVMQLHESATETLLHISGFCVATDFSGKAKVEERNAAYDAMVAGRASSDRYVIRHAQTLNHAQKDAEVMVQPPTTTSVGCESSVWDIYDANEAQSRALADQAEEDETVGAAGASSGRGKKSGGTQLSSLINAEMTKTVSVALAAPDFLLDVSEARVAKPPPKPLTLFAKDKAAAAAPPPPPPPPPKHLSGEEQVLLAQHAVKVLESRELAASLATMERCVQQNLFHHKQLQYRDHLSATEGAGGAALVEEALEEAEEEEENAALFGEEPKPEEAAGEEGGEGEAVAAEPAEAAKAEEVVEGDHDEGAPGASLEMLWAWNAPMTRGRCVTAMSWNTVNEDVLAVGYGGFSYAAPKGGLVLFWSLRNPVYPERVLSLPSGCTAVDFSKNTPHLLAVGMHDGTVAIFNVRREEQGVLATPVLDSEHTPGKHMDPVWQVQWVDKGTERGESLVSISTDGRVVEWSMKKGLEESTLMVLKRVGDSEGVISRQASGLCFDFPHDDAAIYLAGTEDGLLHRCSCSYNEQYLETYAGHTGPVYRIRCSPFWAPAFLSCSADWTVKLWSQKDAAPAHSFHSVDLSDVVHDVAWSPHRSTIFASVAGDGRIEIWDLDQSTLDPVVRQFTAAPADGDLVVEVAAEEAADGAADGAAAAADGGDDGDAPPSTESKAGSTAVLFAKNAPVLVVGDATGNVTCYCIKGMAKNGPQTRAQQCDALRQAIYPEAKTDGKLDAAAK